MKEYQTPTAEVMIFEESILTLDDPEQENKSNVLS
jgi:hypothetical protein